MMIPRLFSTSILPLLLVVLLSPWSCYTTVMTADAVVFFVDPWTIQTYEPRTVSVGDTLTFVWPLTATHNVYLHPSGTCDVTDSVEVGVAPGASYTFVEADEDQQLTFACDVGSHCEAGQILQVTVLPLQGGGGGGGGGEGGDETPTEAPVEDLSPAFVPVAAPSAPTDVPADTTTAPEIDSPTVDITEFPTAPAVGTFEPCFVCGDNSSVPLNPDLNITLPGDDGPTLSCQTVYDDGLDGIINPNACRVVTALADPICRCQPPGFTCSICGVDGEEINDPNANITLPGLDDDSTATCADLEEAAMGGSLTPTECSAISVIASAVCGCAPPNFVCNICGDDGTQKVFAPTAPAFLPGVDEPITCGEMEELGLEPNGLTPTQCSAIQLVGVLPCQCADVDFSCSICGEDLMVGNTTAEFTIPPALSTTGNATTYTCEDAELLGMMGGLAPGQCIAWQPFVEANCECMEDTRTAAPTSFTNETMTPTTMESEAPVTAPVDVGPPSNAPVGTSPTDAPVTLPTEAPSAACRTEMTIMTLVFGVIVEAVASLWM